MWASECGGKEEFCYYMLCLHKYEILTLTVFCLQENTYAEHTEVCVSLHGARPHPCHQFSVPGLGKKFLSYIQCPSYSLLHKVVILKMGRRGHKKKTNHIRNFENMGFRLKFYSNITCTTDQYILPEKNVIYMKKSNFSFRALHQIRKDKLFIYIKIPCGLNILK